VEVLGVLAVELAKVAVRLKVMELMAPAATPTEGGEELVGWEVDMEQARVMEQGTELTALAVVEEEEVAAVELMVDLGLAMAADMALELTLMVIRTVDQVKGEEVVEATNMEELVKDMELEQVRVQENTARAVQPQEEVVVAAEINMEELGSAMVKDKVLVKENMGRMEVEEQEVEVVEVTNTVDPAKEMVEAWVLVQENME